MYFLGQHYWYDVTATMGCDEFWPIFLLYDTEGRLDGFGWALFGDLPSPRYEHPPASQLGGFLPDPYPLCLEEEVFSTLHIYMRAADDSRICP